jgi:threonine/homoserine/homoserine lactone efflux protein
VLTFLLLGAGIGLAAGLSPGPVLTAVVLETFRGGWARGAAIAAGPLLADGPVVAAAVLLLVQLPPAATPVLSLAGGAFFLYLAGTALWESRRPPPVDAARPTVRRGLLTGLLARGLSPHPYLFWLLVGGPLLLRARAEGGWVAAAAFLAGYYLTIVGSNVALALALHRWVGRVSARVQNGLLVATGALLAVYGAALVGRGVAELRTR